MKKILSVCLAVALLANMTIPAFAIEAGEDAFQQNSSVNDFLTTTEDAMPHLSNAEIQTCSQNMATLNDPVRAAWAEATADTLEDAYSQEVHSITETENFVVFTFEEPEEVVNDVGYISKVEYTKPESLAVSSNYETKITYMYGWLDGYYSLEKKSGTWNAIKDTLVTVAGYIESLRISAFAFTVLGIASNFFNGPEIVKAENTAQYYVLNKIGQVRSEVTGLWGQWAYVGSRRTFYRTLLEKEVADGYWNTLGVKETIADDANNPGNADKVEEKTNFNNNTWIINKAISAYEYDRAYIDVYGMTIHFSDTIPKKNNP